VTLGVTNNLVQPSKLIPPAGSRFHLRSHKPDETHGVSREHALEAVSGHVTQLSDLHDLLYAEHKHAVLVILQGMDASGKDGTVKHVMSGLNPRNCMVTSFKVPTQIELDHDFLWRVHAAVPPKGVIGVFNRSHYEDVLATRVHKLITPAQCRHRFENINSFEQMLSENGVKLLKFFLNVSREEQEKRFRERLDDPTKRWKFEKADLKERRHWSYYQRAYEDAISRCNTKHAPWHVVPADHKWFRNYAVSGVLVHTLTAFRMKFPKPKI
jgi:PPK2 family polyphosphate:nucleotide phosphotransferase